MALPSRRAPGSSPRAAQQDTRQPLKRRREAGWHSPSRCCGSIKRKFERRQTRLLSTLRPPAQTNAQVAALMAPGLGRFDSEPPATSERITLLKDVREPGALKPDIIRPPSGTEKYRLVQWSGIALRRATADCYWHQRSSRWLSG